MRLSQNQCTKIASAVQKNGYSLIEDAISIDEIEKVHKVANKKFRQIRKQDLIGKATPRVQKMRLEMVAIPSFNVLKEVDQSYIINSELYDNDKLHQVLKLIFGTDEYYNPILEVTFNLPGKRNQHIHRDFCPILPHFRHSLPTLAVCVAVPLVPTNSENGTIEMWPRTQVLIDSKLQFADDLSKSIKGYKSLRPELKLGDIHIRDSRVIHRGMANHSNLIRPWLSSIWVHPLIRFENKVQLNRATWDSLSDRSKTALRFAEIRESLSCPKVK